MDNKGNALTIKVGTSSGSKVLDDAAVNIVQIASPFPAFSAEMREKYDQLMITRTWVFHSGKQK
jgi:protein TonB